MPQTSPEKRSTSSAALPAPPRRWRTRSRRWSPRSHNSATAAREVRNLAERVESDPARLAEIEERVELLRRLKRKYGGSETAVLAFAEDARAQLERIETADERRQELERALAEASRRAGALAVELSEAREQAATALQEAVAEELRERWGWSARHSTSRSEREEADDGLPAPGWPALHLLGERDRPRHVRGADDPGGGVASAVEGGVRGRDVADDAGTQQRAADGFRRGRRWCSTR